MDIKSVLKKYGVTTYELAERMKIKQPSVMQYVNGNPTAKKLEDLAQAIGCSPAEFFADWNADGQVAAQEQPSAKTEEQTTPGVFVCPHCGAGVSFNTFIVVEPKKDGAAENI